MLGTKNGNQVANGSAHRESDEENDDVISVSSTSNTDTTTHSRSGTPINNSKTNGKRGRKPFKASKTPKSVFKFGNCSKEDHGAELFGTQFNTFLKPGQPYIFATVGGNRVTIYKCLKDGGLKLVQCYSDPDNEEKFYTCAWTTIMVSGIPHPVLAVAGGRGVIRVIDTATMICYKHYIGHGYAVNELKFHPKLTHLLLSASKDHSLRLWNIKSDVCVAIFAGAEGHRDEVLSADFDMKGNRIISAGMDHTMNIWCLDKPEMIEAIENSNTFNVNKSERPFKTVFEHFPDYTTREVHSNYGAVDCICWFGNLLLSKDCKENSIVCWKPGTLTDRNFVFKHGDSSASILQRFDYKDCDIWFMRFALDHNMKYLAFGNKAGKIFLWDLSAEDPTKIRPVILSHAKCTSPIRQVSFSRDARVLVSVCDDGSVWRWDRHDK